MSDNRAQAGVGGLPFVIGVFVVILILGAILHGFVNQEAVIPMLDYADNSTMQTQPGAESIDNVRNYVSATPWFFAILAVTYLLVGAYASRRGGRY